MKVLHLFAVAAMAVAADVAAAQDIPALVGTWKGTAHAVSVGFKSVSDAGDQGAELSAADALEFTFTIKEQQGNQFSGTSTAGTLTRDFSSGRFRPDNKSGVVLDDDGEYLFTIRDNDTLDTCYRHRTVRIEGRGLLCLEKAEALAGASSGAGRPRFSRRTL